MVLQLTSHLHDVNSVNISSRIKHSVYSESDKTLDKLVIQLLKSCSRSTAFIGHIIWPRDQFICFQGTVQTCYDGSSSDLLVKTTIYYNNVSRNAYLQ